MTLSELFDDLGAEVEEDGEASNAVVYAVIDEVAYKVTGFTVNGPDGWIRLYTETRGEYERRHH